MAIQAGLGLSAEKDPLKAAQDAARQAKSNLHADKIDLALVFSTIEFSQSACLKTITSSLGSTNLVGCSGLAVISSQGIFKHGLAILALSFPQGIHFNLAQSTSISTKSPTAAAEELGEKLLYGLQNIRRDISVIFLDGLIPDTAAFLSGIQGKLGRSFPLAGACASDNLAFQKTYQYFGSNVFSDGACGILFGGKLNFGLGTKHGWKALGKPHYVTKARGNTVEEIDNVAAVKIYEEYFAKDIAELKKDLKRISILYPIGLYLPGEEEYLLRNIFSIEDNGTIIFQGNVPQDSQIRLMIGTKESCLSAAKQALDEAKKTLAQPNFLLVFDSISRYILLGRDAAKELEIIKAGLPGDTPIIGIYTYGEQAPLRAINYQGQAYSHNQTITLLGIGA